MPANCALGWVGAQGKISIPASQRAAPTLQVVGKPGTTLAGFHPSSHCGRVSAGPCCGLVSASGAIAAQMGWAAEGKMQQGQEKWLSLPVLGRQGQVSRPLLNYAWWPAGKANWVAEERHNSTHKPTSGQGLKTTQVVLLTLA